jgi:hypothetical protein
MNHSILDGTPREVLAEAGAVRAPGRAAGAVRGCHRRGQSIAEAVRTVRQKSIHHLPVVDASGRLTGILSPHELLESLRRDDEAIRDEALTLALTPGSGVVPGSLHVRCERGHVLLAGRIRTRTDAAALCLQVARIEGLAGLTDRLRWDFDDAEEAFGREESDEQPEPGDA